MNTAVKVLQFEEMFTDAAFGTAELNGRRLDFALKGRSLIISDDVTQEERHNPIREIGEVVRKSWMPV